ncbi:DNA primase small subunit-like [Papaver somniferum]|uniref:DNA primase small subunit-like n=1 Tax=Papaver somniferum TaxID=3469 RepID=UPI000E6FABDB|nr:DNA primase small subunit-like [Papaver somniferum]
MAIAVKVIDSALRGGNSPVRYNFGFTHILWICSGGRGAENQPIRRKKGNQKSHKKVFLGGSVLHPSLVRSYQQVLRPFFEEELLYGQNLLETAEQFEKILKMIPDELNYYVEIASLKTGKEVRKLFDAIPCLMEVYTFLRGTTLSDQIVAGLCCWWPSSDKCSGRRRSLRHCFCRTLAISGGV